MNRLVSSLVPRVGARPILGNFSKIGLGFHWESTYNKKCVTKNPWILYFSNLLLKVVLKKSLVLSPHIMIQKKTPLGSEVAEWWIILTRVWVEGSEPQDKY